MHVYFYLVSIVICSWKISGQSDNVLSEAPQTEIEYQPIGEVKPNESNESSVVEVSTQPLPAEPQHPQVVRPEQEVIQPTQSKEPAPVSFQLPQVQPVSGKATGNEAEAVPPPLVEPEPPVIQPAPVPVPSASGASECHKVMDLGILMDSSNSISPPLWEEEKSIVVLLMDKLGIEPMGTHMSVMTLNTAADFPIPFNGYKNKDELKRRVAELPYRSGWSRLDLGLTAVKNQMFVPQAGVRNLKEVPRVLLILAKGPPDQTSNWKQWISQAADDLKRAQVKIMCVQIGSVMNDDLQSVASSNSLVFTQSDIEGLSGALLDTTAEMCSNAATQLPTAVPVAQPAPAPVPKPAVQPAPAPVLKPVPQPVAQCPIPECSFPSVCVQAAVYATCVPPTSSSANNTCSTPGPCLTTLTKTATDTSTLMLTSTKTETSTAVATLTNTETTTKTNTALTTQTHTKTDVIRSTSTLTTTNTEVATSTHHTTKTSTAILTSHVPVTSTTTLTTTSTGVVNTTNIHTLTSTATSTAVVTSTTNKTNIHTLTTTNTDTVTSTKLATSTSILTKTSTGIETSTLLTTATKTNTVNNTKTATETLTKTLTTIATDTLTQTNVITATTTSTTTATSTATLTATSTAKTTETMTATSTAVLTKTLTNTQTQTKTLTATSTSVVTTCSANCTKIEPTPTHSISTKIVPSTVTPNPEKKGCAVNYTKLGCFKDDRKNPRPLPELLFTDRDSRSKVSSGKTIDWNNWDTYMVDLVCRCAQAAKAKKYTFFSIQYFGECWSGADAGETYNRAGSSDKCVTKGYDKCNPSDKQECVGDKNINFVYGIDIKVLPTQPTLPPTQPPSPTPTPACDQALDIGVIIDSSDSITLDEYNLCLQFVANLVKHFKVSEQGTHFGAIVFSTTPQLQFNFADKQFYKTRRLKNKIKSFPYLGNGTRTDKALSLANMELFSEQGGDREDKPDVLIVITDGRTHPLESQPYSEVLPPLQAKNVRVMAVGVGNRVDKNELITIAMNDKDHVFMVTKYKDLVKILDALLKESCHPVPTAVPQTVTGTLPPPPVANPKKCNIEYQKLGCFVDKKAGNPTLALSEKMLSESNKVDWEKWSVWLPDFVCRCANLVYEKNYNVFGVHSYGECWSGMKAGDTYSMYGAAEQCIDTHQQTCDMNTVGACAGDQDSNYVYRIIISQGAEIQPSLVPTTTQSNVQLQGEVYEDCPVDFIKKGCFNDLQNPRPLPQKMFTDLDNSTAEYSGFPVDWGSWDNYMDDVVCRCAQVSKAKGFKYFGIENFGECWSGKSTKKRYSKGGSSEFCITKEFAQCDTEDRNVCCGNKTTTFIYSIQEEHENAQVEACFTQYENVGCFADKNIFPRPIPELIFTDMDKNSPKYSGKEAQLGELDTYLSDVLCRCAEQAQELGYQYFGVQNHGECYSGANAGQTYSKDGSAEQCITRDFQKCPAVQPGGADPQQDCVGVQGSNYVYRIISIEKESRKDAGKLHLRKHQITNKHGG